MTSRKPHRSCFSIAIALSFALVLGCISDSSAELQTLRRQIANGLPDESDDPAVAFVQVDSTNVCTGSLVSPHVVLTAAHCTEGKSSWRVYFGPHRSAAKPTDWFEVKAGYTDPEFIVHADQDVGHDVGVVVLTKAAPADIDPLPMNHEPITDEMIGEPIHIVGYGRNGTDGTTGNKLQGTGSFDGFTDEELHFPDAPQHECPGDSGGPALMMMDGVPTIIGVVSFHESVCEDGWYSRMDTAADWVDSQIELAEADATEAPDAGGGGNTNFDAALDARPDATAQRSDGQTTPKPDDAAQVADAARATDTVPPADAARVTTTVDASKPSKPDASIPGAADASTEPRTPPSQKDSGCACAVGQRQGAAQWPLGTALLVGALLARAHRRRRIDAGESTSPWYRRAPLGSPSSATPRRTERCAPPGRKRARSR